MKDKLCFELFDFDILKNKKISLNRNEIYNQLLLYIFFSSKKNLLLVYPTLNEATEIYNELKNYINDVYLFPEDDIITKKAIAASPELLFMRANLLNKINDDTQKIVIVHLNSFVKKLPNKNLYVDRRINLKVGQEINREDLIKKLVDIGYKKESVVYDTSDFSVRGFVIDVFPITEQNPVRIEFFDNQIEKIKYFNPSTQITTDSIDSISIGVILDDNDDTNNTLSLKDYLNDHLTVITNYNQLLEQEKMLKPQLKYLEIEDSLFDVKKLVKDDDIYLDTINNKKYDLKIDSKEIEKYNDDKDRFIEDIIKNNGIL